MDYVAAALLAQLMHNDAFGRHDDPLGLHRDLSGWGPDEWPDRGSGRPPRRIPARRRYRARLGLRPAPTGW